MSHYSRISLYGESFCPTHLYKNKKYFMLVQMSGKMLFSRYLSKKIQLGNRFIYSLVVYRSTQLMYKNTVNQLVILYTIVDFPVRFLLLYESIALVIRYLQYTCQSLFPSYYFYSPPNHIHIFYL